jgi:hypothetical protein
MMVTKRTISVRLSTGQLDGIKNWRYYANIHNLNHFEYDENDIISYCIKRVYDDESLFGRMSLFSDKTTLNALSQLPGNISESLEHYATGFLIAKTFRILPMVFSMLEELSEKAKEKNKSILLKKIIGVVISDTNELTRFLIRNSLVSMVSTIYLSYLKGKISNESFKNFILYNDSIPNKNTKFENDTFNMIISRIKKINDLNEFIISIKKAGPFIPVEEVYAKVIKNMASINEKDIAPYNKNDIVVPLIEMERINEWLIPLFEILHMFALINYIPHELPGPASLYPILVTTIYNVSGDKITPSGELYEMIKKSFRDFRFLLDQETDNLKNLTN